VRGSVEVAEVVVCAGPGVGVSHQDGDGPAGGEALEDTGQDLGTVRFSTLRREAALSRSPSVQVPLDVLDRERKARRAAVHHNADSGAMALSPRAEAEGVSVCVAHVGGA